MSRLKAINSIDNFRNWVITSPGPFCERISASGIELKTIRMDHESVNPLNDYRAIKTLHNMLSEELPDIVHTHNSKGGAIGRIAASRAKIPFVVHQVHGFYYKRFSGLKRSIYDYYERFLARCCDLILLQNHEDLQSCIERRMSSKTLLLHIGNGIDLNGFSQCSSSRVSPKASGQIRLVYIGRMDRNKNHRMLFDALRLIKNKVDFSVDLIGDGPLIEENKDYVSSIGISEKVKFHGWIDKKEIPALLTIAHVNILTSKQEGMPRAAMEAAYMGVPTIATNVVGTRDVVIAGKTGLLVPVGDSEGMASQITKLYEDADLWEKLSISSHEYASSHFDEDIIIKRLTKIYHAIKDGTIHELVTATNNGIHWDLVDFADKSVVNSRKEND